MKHFILLLSALALLTACGSSRRVSAVDGTAAWEGRTTSEIMRAMGDPDRIDPDGKGGSILVYESTPDYSSPDYDILAPEACTRISTWMTKVNATGWTRTGPCPLRMMLTAPTAGWWFLSWWMSWSICP